MADQFTLKDRANLKPFGEVFWDITQRMIALSDADLSDLQKSAERASTTNSWCCSYAAAQFLLPEIKIEIYQRKQRANEAAINAGNAQAGNSSPRRRVRKSGARRAA